jgi:hypothetical protein
MTPEAEAKALSDAHEAWKQANIARVLSEMERYGLTIADLVEADTISPMVNQAQTQTLPSTGYKVDGA